MSFLDVAFLPSLACFSTTFLKNYVRGECLCLPYVLILWFGVCNGMLPVKCLCSSNPLFVSFEFHGDHKTFKILR